MSFNLASPTQLESSSYVHPVNLQPSNAIYVAPSINHESNNLTLQQLRPQSPAQRQFNNILTENRNHLNSSNSKAFATQSAVRQAIKKSFI